MRSGQCRVKSREQKISMQRSTLPFPTNLGRLQELSDINIP